MLSTSGRLVRNPKLELVQLRLPLGHTGFWDLLKAVSVVAEDESLLTSMIQNVYEPVGAMRNVSWRCVEISMRKSVGFIWESGNRHLLQKIMDRTLPEPPTVGDFLGAFSMYLKYEKPSKEFVHR